ncbi:MAG TPA: PqqD family protein [Thermoanaerobaculia bacterium]|nr:PqqD family protein [Thermoanaerobaculia bacterium]
MNQIPFETVLRLCPDVRFRLLEGEAIVVRQQSAEVLGLNRLGSRILELFDGSRTLAEVAARLAGEIDVDDGRLTADLLAFAAELEASGVVERVEKP